MTQRAHAALSSVEAERGLLYALLRPSPNGAAVAVPELEPAVFTAESRRVVYSAIRDVSAAGSTVEPIAVIERLSATEQLERAGGPAAISGLTLPENYFGTADVCSSILADKKRRRDLAEGLEQARQIVLTPGGDLGAACAQIVSLANPIGGERRRVGFLVEDVPSVWRYEASISYLVDGLLAESSVTLLSGDAGVGKSTLALSIAGAVAHGHPWAGRAVRQRRVLYLDRENPLYVVKDRLGRLGINATDALTIWGGWVDPGPPAPAVPDILRYAHEHRPLIVVDSLVAHHDGDEQSATDTRKFLDQLRKLANLGATLLPLHHTGKAQTAREYRGSSDIKASMDTAYLLEPMGGDGNKLERLRLRPFKGRFTPLSPTLLEYVEGLGFRPVEDRLSAQREETAEVVEAIVRKSPGCSRAYVMSEARRRGVSRDNAREALATAERDGTLSVETTNRGKKHYTRAVSAWEEF